MRQVLLATAIAMGVTGCGHTDIMRGTTQGNIVWYAETRHPRGADSTVRIIMCSADVLPPCIRFLPRNAASLQELTDWHQAAIAARSRDSTPPVTAADTEPATLDTDATSLDPEPPSP